MASKGDVGEPGEGQDKNAAKYLELSKEEMRVMLYSMAKELVEERAKSSSPVPVTEGDKGKNPMDELTEGVASISLDVPTGAQVAAHLAARNLTQVAASKEMGIDHSTLSKWIKGTIGHYRGGGDTKPTKTTVRIAAWWQLQNMPVIPRDTPVLKKDEGYLLIYRKKESVDMFMFKFIQDNTHRDWVTKLSEGDLDVVGTAPAKCDLVFCVYATDAQIVYDRLTKLFKYYASDTDGLFWYMVQPVEIAYAMTMCLPRPSDKKQKDITEMMEGLKPAMGCVMQ